ncbi:MAG: hypothetical protein AAF198_06335 [Pseudomonadota bacterium]
MLGHVTSLFLGAMGYAQDLHCGDRTQLILKLMQDYREVPIVEMVDRMGNLVEVTASESGSWTLLIHAPDGRVCVLQTGTGFQELNQAG